jgi:GNAT superfamily N-acetyltransferase
MDKKIESGSLLLSACEFKPLVERDIPKIVAAFLELNWNKPSTQYLHYLQEQNLKERAIWTAWHKDIFLGYVTLKWISDYIPFRESQIPEINDLNVLPKFRKQGIGSKLLDLAETEAAQKSTTIGLGVGLFLDYGNAQRLYIQKGYMPDGRGITYKNKAVLWNELVAVDDDLVLWLTKKIR